MLVQADMKQAGVYPCYTRLAFFIYLLFLRSTYPSVGEGAGPRQLDDAAVMTVDWSSSVIASATFPVLTVSHLLRAKLWAWNRRGDQKFDRQDIVWLLESYGDQLDPSVLNTEIAKDFAYSCESTEERDWVLGMIGITPEASSE
jgi:hypothetical protein